MTENEPWVEEFERAQRDRQITLAVSGIGLIISALLLLPRLQYNTLRLSAASLSFVLPFVVCVVVARLIVLGRRRAYAKAKLPQATIART